MKSSIEILQNLYDVLDVPQVNSLITGGIYIGDIPIGNQETNISIKTLTNPNKYLQTGFVNLNIYTKEVKGGIADLGKFKEIVSVLVNLLEDVTKDDFTFQIDDDKGVFKDEDHDNMFFYNIKLKFQTI